MKNTTIIKSIHGFTITSFEGLYQPLIQPNSSGRISYGDVTLTYPNDGDVTDRVTNKFGIESINDAISNGLGGAEVTRTINVFEIR